jgi:hypothetical protein
MLRLIDLHPDSAVGELADILAQDADSAAVARRQERELVETVRVDRDAHRQSQDTTRPSRKLIDGFLARQATSDRVRDRRAGEERVS